MLQRKHLIKRKQRITIAMASLITGDNNAQQTTKKFVNNKAIYMVKKIFHAFCNQQNYLSFKEFKKLDEATEEGESQLTEEMFGQVCHFLMVENPGQGLDINQFSLIYLNQSASEALGSDLNSDLNISFSPLNTWINVISEFEVYEELKIEDIIKKNQK